jgi:hypothetical protein
MSSHPTSQPARSSRAGPLALALALAGCAGVPPPAALRPAPLPEEPQARQLALGQIGRQLYAAVVEGQPERLLVDDLELRSVLESEAATRVAAIRARGSAPGLAAAEMRSSYYGTTYQGVCFDRARFEPAGSNLGLRVGGFVFDRALVVALQPDGGSIASWLEGTFVGTGDQVVALILSRVEAPRREHSDLAILQCDQADGLGVSQSVPGEPGSWPGPQTD